MVAANGLLGKADPSFIGVEPISIDREEPAEKLEGDLQGGSAGGVAQRDQPQRRRTLTAVRRVQTDRQNIKRIGIWKQGLSAFYIAPAQAGFPKFFIAPIPRAAFRPRFFGAVKKICANIHERMRSQGVFQRATGPDSLTQVSKHCKQKESLIGNA